MSLQNKEKPHILILDDHMPSLEQFQALLIDEGYETTAVSCIADACKAVENNFFDVILLDVNLPDGSGLDLCAKIKQMPLKNSIPIILVTAYGSIEMAVKAMELGAFYFLAKPVRVNEFLLLVKRALEHSELHREVARLKASLGQTTFGSMVLGKSHKMKELLTMVAQVAPHDTTVLIQGNSGTGKELVARALHQNSMRSQAPFVTVDCGAISENLLESELFGHVKGAFTGAISNRKGLFVRSNKGTLFLDEVGNLPLSLQVKLLRVLQEHEILPVGSDEIIKVDVRVIAATNIPLKTMVEQGTFRNDLFFRLNVVNLQIPDLKERAEDIPLLAQYFLDKYKSKNPHITGFSKGALKMLIAYDWPGNVRELEHAIEHAVIICQSKEIQPEDLPGILSEKKDGLLSPFPPSYSLEEVENEYIGQVLKHTNYNQTQAANLLHIDRKTLWRKIKTSNIEVPTEESI